MTLDKVAVAQLFYDKLFDEHPSLRRLFYADMSSQYNKLMDTLNQVILYLDKAESWLPEIKNLAVRHVEYEVKEEHYALVGGALIHTLKQGLGIDWNDIIKLPVYLPIHLPLSAGRIQDEFHLLNCFLFQWK